MAINDDLMHLYTILRGESAKAKEFAKQAKAEGNMEDYYFFHGQEGAFNYSINHLKKMMTAYQLKGKKTTSRKRA